MSHSESFLAFDTLSDPSGIEIIDRLEQLRYQLRTPEPVEPLAVSPTEFLFPVGKGVRITTEELVLPDGVSIFVRNADGEMLTEVEHLDSVSLESGSYILDLSTQIKTYIHLEGPVDIAVDLFEICVEFAEPTTIDVGFRSRHTQPATTVTTTKDPVDMMAAISTFGSALKSTSPEHSFPTLRGHPPLIELGDSHTIPDRIADRETDVTIEVPAKYDRIFPVAPLAYYLGAEVVQGEQPQIVTADGFTHGLEHAQGYESAIEQTLKQIFLLDCVTRTEGFYPVTLRERRELAADLEFDWGALYDRPIANRLEQYLSVPYERIAPHIPQWRLTAHVEPVSSTVEQLPFMVDDLAVVRTREISETNPVPQYPAVAAGVSFGETFTRSVDSTDETQRAATGNTEDETTFVEFDSVDSLEQAWIGSGIPIGASKLTADAFFNRLDRNVEPGSISIQIVLNDSRMADEREVVENVYGDRDDLPFDVSVQRNLTVSEFEDTLQEDCDFLHYIGHTDADGFECTDGKLDVTTLEGVEVDSFLLNACRSYHQGLGLISAGAIGGIVTLTDISNDEAVGIGETIARLLNAGFPLRAALSIARDESVLGGQYIVVGDGGMTVTQSPSRTPNLLSIEDCEEDYTVSIQTYTTDTAGLGSMYVPNIGDNTDYFLCSRQVEFAATKSDLEEFLQLQNVPIKADETLYWSVSTPIEEIV